MTRATSVVKSSLDKTVRKMPAGLLRRLFPRDAYVPFCHVVSDEDLPQIRAYAYRNAARFDRDVAEVAERFGFVGYEELARLRLGGGRAKPGRFLFTFDDGFAECFHVVRPILHEHKAPCVFFVTRDFVDDRRVFFECKAALCVSVLLGLSPEETRDAVAALGLGVNGSSYASMTEKRIAARMHRARLDRPADPASARLCAWLLDLGWPDADQIDRACEVLGVDWDRYRQQRPIFMTAEQIRQLHREGFVIGGHGTSHRPLGRLAPEEVQQEIVASCEFVRDLTGQKKVPFAFPWSGSGIDPEALAQITRRYDFIELFFDSGGLEPSPPHIVNRFWADFFDDGSRVRVDASIGWNLRWHLARSMPWHKR